MLSKSSSLRFSFPRVQVVWVTRGPGEIREVEVIEYVNHVEGFVCSHNKKGNMATPETFSLSNLLNRF